MDRIGANDARAVSADVIAENIRQLKTLFPELFTERPAGIAVNEDVLKQLVGDQTVTDSDEKYGLNWHGKRAARRLALTPSTGTLRPCPEESVDWDTTQNLMIEGDNLEVLKLLQKSYAGKVKLIYIDPPYNTGKDFVYPDDYRDGIRNYMELTGQVDGGQRISSNTEASGRFHTDWLNMMYPRLRLARNLISRNGLLLISIDEHEFSNLVNLLDEVFGRENLIGQVSVVNNLKGRSDDAFLATCHESLLVYAKDIGMADVGGLPLPPSMVEEYDLEDDVGQYKLIPLKKTGKGWRREDRPNMFYPIYISSDCETVGLSAFPGALTVLPMRGEEEGRWRWGKDTFQARAKNDVVARRVRSGSVTVFSKMRLGEGGEDRTLKAKTTWIDPKFDSAAGGRDLAVLGMQELFPNPKPIAFLDEILTIAAEEDSIVLDFFAGSGTTGHAVVAKNATDEGRRHYVLVQLPEKLDPENKEQKMAADFCDRIRRPRNIAEVTKERLRRAAKKVKEENRLFAGDLGFRVFKLAATNIREWDPNPDNVTDSLLDSVEHLKTDRTEDDILYELLLKRGLDLCVPMETRVIAGKTVHSIGAGTLIVCLAPGISRNEAEPLAQGIIAWHKGLAPAGDTTCVFRDSGFVDDVAKTNLAAILQQAGLEHVESL